MWSVRDTIHGHEERLITSVCCLPSFLGAFRPAFHSGAFEDESLCVVRCLCVIYAR